MDETHRIGGRMDTSTGRIEYLTKEEALQRGREVNAVYGVDCYLPKSVK